MKNNRTNKPIKNFQKKKYYTNRNYKQKNEVSNKSYSDLFRPTKPDPWLDGTFAVDAKTFEVKHIPPK